MNGLQLHPLPIPGNRLVVQAVEQCFVGSLLQFGFRVRSPLRTTSQIARNSPFHLKNIVRKVCVSENSNCHSEGLPSLLACQIFPCFTDHHQAPTVLQILNENILELLKSTPQSFVQRVSLSQHLSLVDCSQTEASFKARFEASYTSLQGNVRASPLYCTPQDFCAMIPPLVLTGFSQSSSGSNSPQNQSQRPQILDHLRLDLKG